MSIHVYRTNLQKLTFFKPYGATRYVRIKPMTLAYCDTCGRRRRAKNLLVQAYYDKIHTSCQEGHLADRYGRFVTATLRSGEEAK